MSKYFRWGVRLTAGAALVCLAAFAAMEYAKTKIDPNTYRAAIVEEITKAAGAEAGFERIEWLPYRPGVALVFPYLQRDGVAVRAARIEATVNIVSLLSGTPRLSLLKVDGLALNVERGAKGEWNIASFFKAAGGGDGLPDSIELNNANITLLDSYVEPLVPAIMRRRETPSATIPLDQAFLQTRQAVTEPLLTAAAEGALSFYFQTERLAVPEPAAEPPPPTLLQLRAVQLHFHQGGLLFPARIECGAQLIDPSLRDRPLFRSLAPARISFNIKTRMRAPDWDWNASMMKGKIGVSALYSGSLERYLGDILPDHYARKVYNFDFQFNGRLAEKFSFNGSVAARPVEEVAGPALVAGLSSESRRLNLAGSIAPDRLALDRMEIFLPDARVDARVAVTNYRKADPDISFKIDTSFIDVEKVERLVPPAYAADPMIQLVRKTVDRGRFKISGLAFNGPYSAFIGLADPANMKHVSGALELEGMNFFAEGMTQPLSELRGRVSVRGDSLLFQDLAASYGRSAISGLSGGIADFRTAPRLHATLNASVDMPQLREELMANLPAEWVQKAGGALLDAKGSAATAIAVDAGLMEPLITALDARIVFADASFRNEEWKTAVTNINGMVRVTLGDIEMQGLTMDVEGARLTLSGAVRKYASDVPFIDLRGSISGGIPALERIAPLQEAARGVSGPVNGTVSVTGALDDISFRQELDLGNADLKMLGFIDKRAGAGLKLSSEGRVLNGRALLLREARLEFGNSRIRLAGETPDMREWPTYSFKLNVESLDLADFPSYFAGFTPGNALGGLRGEMAVYNEGKGLALDGAIDASAERLMLEPLERWAPAVPPLKYFKLEGVVAGEVRTAFHRSLVPVLNGWLKGEKVGFDLGFPHKFRGISGHADLRGDKVVFKDIPVAAGKTSAVIGGTLSISADPKLELAAGASRFDLADFIWLKGKPDAWWRTDPAFHMLTALSLSAKQGDLIGLSYKDLALSLRYYRDKFTISRLGFGAYRGRCEASAIINTAPAMPLFKAKVKVKNVEMEDMFKELWPSMDKVTGLLSARGEFSGEGLAWKDMRHTVNGTMRFESRDGLLAQFAGIASIMSVVNLTPMVKSLAPRQKGAGLVYDSIKGTMKLENGVGHTDDTTMEGGVIRMSAVGDFRFNDNTVKLLVGVKPFTSVDSLLSSIPIAGTIVTGEQKSFIVSYYDVTGSMNEPVASAVPGESVARTIFGILQRVLEAPARALSTKKGMEKKEKTPTVPPLQ